jgi:CheY-like chemotaxis protein
MADPIIMVVEDHAEWRLQLAQMYSRILRGKSNRKNADSGFHPTVHTFSTAQEAIEFVKKRPGDRSNSKSKVDIMSLDLNLGRNQGGTGMDVLNAAVANGQKFATIAITGYASDDDLRDQMSDAGYQSMQSLRTKVEAVTKAECVVYHKHAIDRFGDIPTQIGGIESDLVSRCSGNVLRNMHAKLRETIADLNGKCFCLHFKLPKDLFLPCPGDWVAASVLKNRSMLNQLSVWKGVFHPLDEDATQTDILARLLFLVTPGKYLAGVSLQEDPTQPLPEDAWLAPQPRVSNLTSGEAFLMLQLIAQGWALRSSGSRRIGASRLEDAYSLDEPTSSELQISGLIRPTKLGWAKGNKKSVHENGEPLSVERFVDSLAGRTDDGALKTNASRLHTSLKEMLGGVDYPVISATDTSYELATFGQVFIHRAKE